jgi:hypothetical protein
MLSSRHHAPPPGATVKVKPQIRCGPEILRRIELEPTAAGGQRSGAGLTGEKATRAGRGAKRCIVSHDAVAAQLRHRPAGHDAALVGRIAGEIVR